MGFYKLFTEFLQDISATFDQDQGIPVDTLLMVYLLFADDLVLFSESAEGLQKQLTALYLYVSLWHIIVSIPKTKVLFLNERYTKVRRSFHYPDDVNDLEKIHLKFIKSTRKPTHYWK